MLTKRIETRWHRVARLAPFHFMGESYANAEHAYDEANAWHVRTGRDVVVTDRDHQPVFTITTETFGPPPPYQCKLCGQHIADGKPCGCGYRAEGARV